MPLLETIKQLALESEQYTDNQYKGGANDDNIELNYAGFPPIYEIFEKGDIKKREYMSDNSIMNVHNILNNRKNVPFLPMRPRGNVKLTYNNIKQKNK
jgi:hypothetical protein